MGDEVAKAGSAGRHRAGRRVRAAGTALAAALAGAAFFPRGATADTGGASGPAIWQAEAVASGVQVAANEKGFILADILNANIPDGDSAANSSGQDKSRASTFYPGLALTQGPSLLCTAGVPCPPGVPPAWPLTTYAQYPSQPSSSVATGQRLGGAGSPLALVANSADARAGPEETSTRATVADLSVPGDASTQAASAGFHGRAARILGRPRLAVSGAGSSSLLRVGSGLATTSVTVDRGAVRSTADTVLHQVSLLGGIVTVASIHATSTTTTDGAGVTKASGRLTVSGVQVAGQAATIDPSGVRVLPGPGIGGDQVRQLNQALQQALAAAGWRLALLGVSDQRTPDAPKASAQGVMLYSQADFSAVPAGSIVYSTFLLGSADSQASASAGQAAGTGSALTGIPGSTGGAPVGGGAGNGVSGPLPAGPSDQGSLAGPAATSPSASGGRAPAASRPSGAGPLHLPSDGLAAHRTTITYLTAAVLVLVLALAAPGILPALAGGRRARSLVTGPRP